MKKDLSFPMRINFRGNRWRNSLAILSFLIMGCFAFSQTITIGTGTVNTAGNGSDPIDDYFNSMRYQVVYTAAELSSAGLTPYDALTGVGFSVTESPGTLANYTIKIGHTAATNSASHNTATLTTVRNAANYTPTVVAEGVFDMLNFDTTFVWNGVDNIVIDICTGPSNPYVVPYGGVRATTMTTGSRFVRADSAGSQCGVNTNTTNGNRPNVQFSYIDGLPPSCMPSTGLTLGTVGAYNVQVSWSSIGNAVGYDWFVFANNANPAVDIPLFTGNVTPSAVNITGLNADTAYDFYVMTDCGIDGESVLSAKLDFTTTIACPVPTTLIATAVTHNSATLGWTSAGSTFDVEWGQGTFTQGTGTLISGVSGNSTPLNGLLAGTAYRFYVRQDCGIDGTSTWAGPFNFTTQLVVPTPYEYGFATTALPSGWSNSGFTIGTSVRLPEADGNVIHKNLYTGAGNSTGFFSIVNVGPIVSGDALTFTYRLGNWDAPYAPPAVGSGNFIVAISTDFGANYTNVETVVNNGIVGWQNYSYDLSAYIGQNVKVRITGNWISGDYVLGFDDLMIGTPPACVTPTGLTASNITGVTADLTWGTVASASGYNWFVFESGADPIVDTPLQNGSTTATSVSLSGLVPGDTYDVYVQSDCGVDGTSAMSGVVSFTTQIILTTPWFDDLEADVLPGWSWTDNNAWGTDEDPIPGGDGSYYSPNLYGSNTTESIFTPNVGLVQTGDVLKFDFALINYDDTDTPASGSGNFTVGISTNFGTTYTIVETVTNDGSTSDWQGYSYDLSAYVGQNISVRVTGNRTSGDYYLGLDNFYIGPDVACLISTTWDGLAWSNGLPDVNTKAIVDGDLTLDANLEACELEVTANGSVEIPSGLAFTINGVVTNNAAASDFIVQSGANLIQNEDLDNVGEITVMRDSQPMKRLDYTMWSSPVTGQQLQAFSPMTLPNRIYTYEGASGYLGVTDALADFASAKGYLFRSPNDWDATIPTPYIGEFSGVPFNGNLTVNTISGSYTSIGNPYPSNIDADALLAANTGISTLYYWNNTGVAGSNYASYTSLGGTAAGGGSEVPDKFISVGQGFLVQTTDTSVNFTNEMRVADAGTFFKGNTTEKHRIWLNLNNEQKEDLNQILVGYMTGATQGIDNQIDGKWFASEKSALYNIIGEEKFSIQGRALPFEISDVVALGFKAAEAGKFNISLAGFDGMFLEGNITVYLRDNELNITHNLMESEYLFESSAGEFKSRFEIVYQKEEVMGTGDLTSNSVQIYTNNDQIVVSSKSEKILSVELFDLQGRNIHSNNNVNANTYQIKSASKGVLVVRVQTQNGEILTKKIINK